MVYGNDSRIAAAGRAEDEFVRRFAERVGLGLLDAGPARRTASGSFEIERDRIAMLVCARPRPDLPPGKGLRARVRCGFLDRRSHDIVAQAWHPYEDLAAGRPGRPLTAADLDQIVRRLAPGGARETTIGLVSPSGWEDDLPSRLRGPSWTASLWRPGPGSLWLRSTPEGGDRLRYDHEALFDPETPAQRRRRVVRYFERHPLLALPGEPLCLGEAAADLHLRPAEVLALLAATGAPMRIHRDAGRTYVVRSRASNPPADWQDDSGRPLRSTEASLLDRDIRKSQIKNRESQGGSS